MIDFDKYLLFKFTFLQANIIYKNKKLLKLLIKGNKEEKNRYKLKQI